MTAHLIRYDAHMKRAALALLPLVFSLALFGASAPSPTPAPAPAPAAAPSPLETAARTLLADFTAGRYEAAAKNFDAKMLEALPPAKLAEFAKQLTAQVGAFKNVRDVKQGKAQGYDVVVLVSEYEKAVVNVQVAFDPDGKVAGLYFRPAQ